MHGDDDVRLWFANVVIVERQVWLAEAEGQPVEVMVLDEGELDQLYVHPSWQGHGVGAEFVEFAKRERPDGLSLWTFESNRGAQLFYERNGFRIVGRSDGSENEERAPALRYSWIPER